MLSKMTLLEDFKAHRDSRFMSQEVLGPRTIELSTENVRYSTLRTFIFKKWRKVRIENGPNVKQLFSDRREYRLMDLVVRNLPCFGPIWDSINLVTTMKKQNWVMWRFEWSEIIDFITRIFMFFHVAQFGKFWKI